MNRFVCATIALTLYTNDAFAHASERGHVLLLPTGYYLIGGALAVAASFLVLAFVHPGWLQCYARWRLPIVRWPPPGGMAVSALSSALFVLLVSAGFLGSPDPLHNPLPTFVWTIVWVGLTLACAVFGNLWAWLNPWRWAVFVVGNANGRLELPAWLGRWPAVALFSAFAWFELIDIAPEDPRRLAAIASAYWLFTFIGCLLFGYASWMKRCELLSVFFGMVSRFAVFDTSEGRLSLCLPGAQLERAEPLDFSGLVFLLAALASVSFDGLSKTFVWLSAIGINPLEFPGRSVVAGANSAGLALAALTLIVIFVSAVWLGLRLAGQRGVMSAAGMLVWSIVPIAIAYHFSHYLTALLVDGQYALIALSDPFARGWNLLGLTGHEVSAGISMGHQAAWLIWNAQAFAIVGGHVVAVLVAHMLALRLYGEGPTATASQLPLALLMVAYTLFGLWLLSTLSIG